PDLSQRTKASTWDSFRKPSAASETAIQAATSSAASSPSSVTVMTVAFLEAVQQLANPGRDDPAFGHFHVLAELDTRPALDPSVVPAGREQHRHVPGEQPGAHQHDVAPRLRPSIYDHRWSHLTPSVNSSATRAGSRPARRSGYAGSALRRSN